MKALKVTIEFGLAETQSCELVHYENVTPLRAIKKLMKAYPMAIIYELKTKY